MPFIVVFISSTKKFFRKYPNFRDFRCGIRVVTGKSSGNAAELPLDGLMCQEYGILPNAQVSKLFHPNGVVLERFFGMTSAQSYELMLIVHKKGVAVVGVYSHEIAETKVAQVMDYAQRHQHPLQCTMEKE